MKKICSRCGKLHDVGYLCQAGREKRTDKLSLFRHTQRWVNKSAAIRNRDNNLCQLCLLDNKFTYDCLSVHHIVPLVEDFERRLDDDNLITICDYHHKLAEKGNIERKIMFDIASKNNKKLNDIPPIA